MLFYYLIGYKAWLLAKLSWACLLVKKIIYNKILKYQRIHWENIREKINATIIIHLQQTLQFFPVRYFLQHREMSLAYLSRATIYGLSVCSIIQIIFNPRYYTRRTNFAVQRYSNIPTVWLISPIPLQKKRERSVAAKLKLVWSN